MPSFFKVLFEQIVGVLKELSTAQKITLFLLGTVIFVSLFALTMWGIRPDFVPLYSGLTQQDAGEVVKKLAEKNIAYKLAADGTTILVPSKVVREARVSLASEGLPKTSGFGYELFDQFKLGTTEFTQKVNYQRALETELARTITGIKQIKGARVHIVMPDDSLFVEDKQGASASLVLDILGNQTLNSDQINGIVHLVASSVKGLAPKNITIVDTNGNVLYSFSEDEEVDAGLTMKQVEVQKKYERIIQNRIETMLNKVFGNNTSVVRVNLDMNFDKTKSDSELYLPSAEPLVRSERSVEEGFKGNNAAPPAGVNVPAAGQGNAQNSNYTKLDETKNYELSKKMEHFSKAPGSIIRMTIAVILDRKIKEDEKNNLIDAISSASGLNKERGDILTFSTFPFDKSTLEQDKKEIKVSQRNQFLANLGKNIGLTLLLIITVIYARGSLKKLSAISVSGGSWGVNVSAGKTKEVPRVVMEDEPELSPEDQKRVAMKNTIVDMIHSDPEVFAKILRRWLSED